MDKKRSARKKTDSCACDKNVVVSFDSPQCGETTLNKVKTAVDIDKINWFAVQQWFLEGILRNDDSWLPGNYNKDDKDLEKTQAWWGWREKNPAERMLKAYGPELTKKAVLWLCDNWKVMKERSNGELRGAPTINFLWVCREQIIPDVREGKKLARKRTKKHMVAEHDSNRVSKLPKIGWGDE